MIGIKRVSARLKSAPRVLPAGVMTLTAALSALFRRSLAVRIAEQTARIERTGLAGMI